MARANVGDIASFFIALCQDVGEQLTHMKLQKLLYYSQAWYLGMYGDALFNSKFEAWPHGPVCPDIYHEYKSYGSAYIPFAESCSEVDGCLSIVEKRLDADVVCYLKTIADDYMKYSAFELSKMTHMEQPWIKSINGNMEITQNAMREYYSELVLDEEEIDDLDNACRDIQDGKGIEWKPGMFS